MWKAIWDYTWISVVITAIVIGSVMIPWACQAQELPEKEEVFFSIPDRKAWFQSPVMAQMIHAKMVRAMKMRERNPEATYLVQAWADMQTGIWNLNVTIGTQYWNGHVVTWNFVMALPGAPTPYEYRSATKHEAIYAVYLTDYEWYYGRHGDI